VPNGDEGVAATLGVKLPPMATKLRLGLASLVHDHVWGVLPHWQSHTEIEIVAVGEPDEAMRKEAAEKTGAKPYATWQEMIETEQLDIVLASSDNATSADITEAAMAKGAHVVTEKPMAATLAQANRMVAAAKKHDRLLMVNWPNQWEPAYVEWERRAKSGEIGRLIHVKRRNAHNGPREIGCNPAFVEWLYDEERNGAGAFMDYCCYGAAICAYLLGLPNSVIGQRAVLAKEYPVPDDNAIVLMQYDHAFGQTEASWTEIAYGSAPSTIAYGTAGILTMEGKEVVFHRPGQAPDRHLADPIEAPRRNSAEYFVHCLRTGEPIEGIGNMDVARNAQSILDAGLRSANAGVRVTPA